MATLQVEMTTQLHSVPALHKTSTYYPPPEWNPTEILPEEREYNSCIYIPHMSNHKYRRVHFKHPCFGGIRMQQRRRVSTRHINRTIRHVVSTHLWCASFSSCDRPRISLPVSFCPVFLVHSFSRTRNLQLAIQSATDQSLHDPAYQSITLKLLENVEHCRGKPGQADTRYMSLMSDVRHQVNHPPTCTSIYNSQGALQVFLLVGLLICHFI